MSSKIKDYIMNTTNRLVGERQKEGQFYLYDITMQRIKKCLKTNQIDTIINTFALGCARELNYISGDKEGNNIKYIKKLRIQLQKERLQIKQVIKSLKNHQYDSSYTTVIYSVIQIIADNQNIRRTQTDSIINRSMQLKK